MSALFARARCAGWLVISLALLLSACSAAADRIPDSGGSAQLQVVATTTLVGDVVQQVGGESIELSILLPAAADPHGFEPAPQDIARVAQADLIFASGLGLETFLDSLIRNAGGGAQVVSVSDGVPHQADPSHEEESGGVNPHVWFDPNNVIIWTENIENALVERDPDNRADYSANAEDYRRALTELDGWIAGQVAQIPAERRKLVTDHQVFGYFAERYGFEQVGVLYGGFSGLAEPSPQDLAALYDAIQASQISAIFVSTTVNPDLAQRIADDTGVRLIPLYTDSLTAPGDEADSYLNLMRYDVNAIVEALKKP